MALDSPLILLMASDDLRWPLIAFDCPLLHQVSHDGEMEGDESDEMRAAFPQPQATPLPAGVRARMRCPFRVAADAGCLGEVTRMRPTLRSAIAPSSGSTPPRRSHRWTARCPAGNGSRLQTTRSRRPWTSGNWYEASALLLANTIRCEFTISGLIGCAPARRA
jgi:hypothetical protein